ncbi:MAG TPA: hypothetical protein VFT67_01745 [Jatrophihabitantaceae bacterium]|nr:hypothetical protein [Jatrophihabitantaceae bacterium]
MLATLAAGRTATLGAHGRSPAAALVGGYHLAFWVAAGLLVAAVAVGLLVLERADASASQAPVAPELPLQSLPDSPSMIA